mgnify:FL=1
MAKIFFCPHCGNKLHLSSDADLVQYKNGVCKYCGFIGDFIDVGLSNDEFFSQIDDYATQKNIDIDATFENMWRTRIEMFNIDQDPRFDWDASLKSMKEKDKELLEADLQFKARQNAKKAAANTLHCPTCGSTNIKKLDVVDRAVSVGFFGIFSNKINKSFKCKDCGCTW